MPQTTTDRVTVHGPAQPDSERVLTADALAFLRDLHDAFDERRRTLLQLREERAHRLRAGELPGFLDETRSVRDADWTVAETPADLQRRVIEITGPVDRKMMINALNSGADVFMADFEDALSPTWENVVAGQGNCQDAIRRSIALTTDEGKDYRLNNVPLK